MSSHRLPTLVQFQSTRAARPSWAEADVVAPHVEVKELAAVERRRLGRSTQLRERVG
jgi:hypothetical protein